MLLYLRENIQFTIMVLIWLLTGAYLGNVAVGIVGASFFLLTARGYYTEILMGFWLILMFSDSRIPNLLWAQTAKKILIVLLLMILFLRRREMIKSGSEIFSLFLPFFIWSILLVYDSPWPGLSMQKTLSYAFLFLIVPVFTRYILSLDQRAFFRTIIYVMMAYLILGIVIRYYDFDLVYQEERFRGFMGNPNGLGVLVFVCALLFDTISRKDPEILSRWGKLFVWAVLLLNIMYCQSRSALFAILLYLLFSKLRILRGFIGILIFVVVLVSYNYVLENLGLIVNEFGLEHVIRTENIEGGSGRKIAWEFAWGQIQENILVGKGFAYTDWIFWQHYDELTNMGHLGNAHNSFLTFWLDTGLIGLLMFVIAFLLLFYRISKIYYNAIPVMYAIVFSASFESWLTASLNPNTITLLIILSIMLYAKDGSPVLELEDQNEPATLDVA